MRRLVAISFALLLVACARHEDGPAAAADAPSKASTTRPAVRGANEIAAAFMKDHDALLREITRREYPLQLALMRASGVEADLGGATAADRALRGVMNELRVQTTAFESAHWQRVADGGELTGATGVAASSLMLMLVALDYANVYGDGTPGKTGRNADSGSTEMETGAGQVSFRSEHESSSGGLNGKFLTQMKVNVCPDAAGKVTVEVTSGSALSRGGAGAKTTIKVTVVGYVNDDAVMTDYDTHKHVESAVFGGHAATFVDMDSDSSTRTEGAQGARVNLRSSQATDSDVAAAGSLADILGTMALVYVQQTSSVWEHDKCVKLDPETTPGQRQRVKPSSTFSIHAAPRSRVDGSSVGGTVRAKLKGGSSLDPGATPIRADATYTYVAPNERDKQATVSAEARSRRGVAHADVSFSTAGDAYAVQGEADKFDGAGIVCNFEELFSVTGNGVSARFEPTSREGGRYSYSGTLSGFRVYGHGTYQVTYAGDVPVRITAKGPGNVVTPYGTQTAEGTEVYTVEPHDPIGCGP